MFKRMISILVVACLSVALFSVGFVFPVVATDNNIEIVSAKYGHNGQYFDVTNNIRSKLNSDGTISAFSVSNESMGFYPTGENNYLIVCYKKNGAERWLCIKNGKEFSIPYKLHVDQSDETNALINSTLASTTKDKVWPETGIRGFNFTGLIGSFSDNEGNEGVYVTEDVFKKLKGMGVNCLRIMFGKDYGTQWALDCIPEENPVAPYWQTLNAIKVALKLAEKYDMYIILAADEVVGRKIDVMYNNSDGSGYNQTLKDLWIYVAKNYGAHPNLLGYDLLNEPNTSNDVAYYLDVVLPDLVETVRKYDKNTYLIVEPAKFAAPNYFSSLVPIDDPKAIYSFHFYWPHQYTHQGIGDYGSITLRYPGMMGNYPTDTPVLWDSKQLEKSVSAVIKFQQKYNAKVWIGEFGVVRWAPNGAQWMTDAISLFEKYGWDWCAHNYGGYNGWNPTFDAEDKISNIMDGGKETEILKILKEGFALNGKPKNISVNNLSETNNSNNSSNSNHSSNTNNSNNNSNDTEQDDELEIVVLNASGIKIASASLSKDWEFSYNRISKGKEYDNIKKNLPKEASGFAAYNLFLKDENNQDVVLDEEVEVNIPLSKGMSDIVVYKMGKDNALHAMDTYVVDGVAAFKTDALGVFAIVKTNSGTETKYVLNTISIIFISVCSLFAILEVTYVVIKCFKAKR